MVRAEIDSNGLTAVILTLNEETRLAACLDAIPKRYPVLVLDSGSTDGTVEIAQERGCSTAYNAWPGFAAQRNFALESCGIESDWVLFVDADETYPPEFFDWFEREVRERHDFDAAMVASILIFKGIRLRHAPGYPIYHPRLVRRRHTHFVPNHTGFGESINAGARLIQVDIPYDHWFYDGDLAGWMRKHIGYADKEAQGFSRDGNKHVTARASISRRIQYPMVRVPLRFLYHYLIRGGFRDGRAGFEYTLMYTWYEATKFVLRSAGSKVHRSE